MTDPRIPSQEGQRISKIRPRKVLFFNFLFILNFALGIFYAVGVFEMPGAIGLMVSLSVAGFVLWQFWIRKVFVLEIHPTHIVAPVSWFHRKKLDLGRVDIRRSQRLIDFVDARSDFSIFTKEDEMVFFFPRLFFSARRLKKAFALITANLRDAKVEN